MKIIHKSKYETVYYKEELQQFEAIWYETSEKMKDEDYRNELKIQFEFLKKTKIKRVLFHTLDFKFIILPETQVWNNDLLTSTFKEIGVEKVALVVSPDIFTKVALEQTMNEKKDVTFETKYFETEEEARGWLEK